jgi:hypothetical protein
MNLKLKISREMLEDNLIGISKNEMDRLKVSLGEKLLLRNREGVSLPLFVKEIQNGQPLKKYAYVSRKIFNIFFGLEEKPYETTLGCDPEFVFVTQGIRRVIPADQWLAHKGVIGSDGPLAELRPSPSQHEDEAVNKLRRLILCLPKIIEERIATKKKVHPEGHSCWENYALGFHIHLGAPKEVISYAAPDSSEFIRSFVAALDYFVGIPAMLLEDSNTRRLGNGMYGKPGDFRVSSCTLEYRTPGGFHLRHPDYARGILGISLCVGSEIFSHVEEVSLGWRELNKFSNYMYLSKKYNLPQKEGIQKALLDPSKRIAVGLVPDLLNQLKRFPTYQKHAAAIKNYFRLVARNQQYSPNLLTNW